MSAHQILDPNGVTRVPPQMCALGIMTKAPEAGKVKTRLTPPLTPQEAAELNICFLRDVAEAISKAGSNSRAHGVGIYTPLGSELVYENILPQEFFLIPQRGEDFGERLRFAAEDLFSVGFESVCLINSDSPTIPGTNFAEAIKELAKEGDSSVVLGPSDDGGYYLIGLKSPNRQLFEEIDWSTDRVLTQTKERATEAGVKVHELPRDFDVDDSATLRRLCQELFGSNAEEKRDRASNTRNFLNAIITREGRDRIWPR